MALNLQTSAGRVRRAVISACMLLVAAQLLSVASGQTTYETLFNAIKNKQSSLEISGTVKLIGNLPEISHSMTIVGTNKAKIDADEWSYRIFVVKGPGKLVLKDIELYKGQPPLKSSKPAKLFPPLADGGAVLLYGGATGEFDNVFFNHSKSWRGAGVAAYGGSTVKVSGSWFLNNYAWYAGGAIYLAEKSTGSATSTRFERNKGPDEGGAIVVTGGSQFTSTGCRYRKNTCKEEGGGAWALDGAGSWAVSANDTFVVNRCEFKSARGGAIIVSDKATLFVLKSTFDTNRVPSGIGNTIWVDGGVIGLLYGPPTSVVEFPKGKAVSIPTNPTGITIP
ncbi:hypothetical protein CBR_g48891 [Chara braunii]|uniref:Right handed beta helix domain-containing protein n=1 Tax=Chara braunii TaxID=69332 RepID=A0A388M3N1_CHABU|nr:hypothetical protein CBR_g48891 [Chara braunii]|eukprot:GBG89184.1 hypothetical protein CBR_g48891 [Chara braunii]